MLIHQARQPRSQQSEQRLLDAAEHLLQHASWPDISIASIAQQAGMSVGGFYARFKSKDALLLVLHERYLKRRTEFFENLFASGIRDRPLPDRVEELIGGVADWMDQNRGVLRTFLLRFWSRPEEFDGAFGERLESIYRRAENLLVGSRKEIRHRHPRKAARMAIAVSAAACRDALVLKPAPNPGAVDVAVSRFRKELVELALSYLGSSGGGK